MTIEWYRPIPSSTRPRCRQRRATLNPVLIRIDTQSGHGASNTSKALDTAADIYSFLMYNLGVERPAYRDNPNTSQAKCRFLTPGPIIT